MHAYYPASCITIPYYQQSSVNENVTHDDEDSKFDSALLPPKPWQTVVIHAALCSLHIHICVHKMLSDADSPDICTAVAQTTEPDSGILG